MKKQLCTFWNIKINDKNTVLLVSRKILFGSQPKKITGNRCDENSMYVDRIIRRNFNKIFVKKEDTAGALNPHDSHFPTRNNSKATDETQSAKTNDK